jgi:hypothetical protein
MADNNLMILVDREEIELLVKRDITDDEWQKVRSWIASDDNMWSVIDECIKNTIDEVLSNG